MLTCFRLKDVVVALNKEKLKNKSVAEIQHTLRSLPPGPVELLIKRTTALNHSPTNTRTTGDITRTDHSRLTKHTRTQTQSASDIRTSNGRTNNKGKSLGKGKSSKFYQLMISVIEEVSHTPTRFPQVKQDKVCLSTYSAAIQPARIRHNPLPTCHSHNPLPPVMVPHGQAGVPFASDGMSL